MTNAANSEVAKLSSNLWRPSSLVPDGPKSSNSFGLMSEVRPESLSEAQFIASPTPRRPFPMPPSPISGASEQVMPRAANPIAGALAASLQESSESLTGEFNDRHSRGTFSPISDSSIHDLKADNPIAHDRLQALSADQRQRSFSSGPAHDVMLLIPPVVTNSNASPWEELFAAQRSESGPTLVSGLRLHNQEWYHFNSQIATPPKSFSNHPRGGSAPAASTSFAPLKLLQSKNPASLTDLGSARVRKDVQGITEGPWRPFLQGKTLKGSDHAVQGVHSSPKGLDAFKSAYDSVHGVLKKIQDISKGIMKVADFFGIVGELGQFGDVLKWIGALNLPKSPADLINSILLGKGILPDDTIPPPIGICNGSGEGGLVVTKTGPAAEHLGKGMLLDVKILQQKGEGTGGPAAKVTNGVIGGKPTSGGTEGEPGKESSSQPTPPKEPPKSGERETEPGAKKPVTTPNAEANSDSSKQDGDDNRQPNLPKDERNSEASNGKPLPEPVPKPDASTPANKDDGQLGPTPGPEPQPLPTPTPTAEQLAAEELAKKNQAQGLAGAERGREAIKDNNGDLIKARSEVIDARHETYDNKLADRIAERDGLNASERQAIYDKIHTDQNFRKDQVQSFPQQEREGFHDPVLTNADRYLEMRIQSEVCGTGIADIKAGAYDVMKGIQGDKPTDGDGRSASNPNIGQSTADDEATRDAAKDGQWPIQNPIDCVGQSGRDLANHGPRR